MRDIASALRALITDTIGLEGALIATGAIGLYFHLVDNGEAKLAGLIFWGGLILAGIAVARPRRT